MSDWHVLVGSTADERFTVWVIDFRGLEVMAEDRGPNGLGYTEPELGRALAETCGLRHDAIESLIQSAKHSGLCGDGMSSIGGLIGLPGPTPGAIISPTWVHNRRQPVVGPRGV